MAEWSGSAKVKVGKIKVYLTTMQKMQWRSLCRDGKKLTSYPRDLVTKHVQKGLVAQVLRIKQVESRSTAITIL